MNGQEVFKMQSSFIRKEDKDWSFSNLSRKETNYLTHGYHKYPAKFIPQLVSKLIENYSSEGDLILDPFGGCGTTLVESKLNRRNSIGIDINDIAVLISKTNYNYIRYKNKLNKRDLLYLLIWVKAEGHISLYKQWIEIKQDEGGINILNDLSKISKKLFKVNEKTIHIRTQKPHQNMKGLRINSAPLRQLLILKYGIDPGYKCQTISLKKEIEMLSNREDLYFLLAKLIEAEGSFSFSKWKEEKYSRISITTTSKKVLNEITDLLKKEGYPLTVSNDRRKKNVGYTIGIQTINEVIKFCFYILPYFQHKKKIKNFIKEIQKKSFARKIRLNSTKQIIKLIETSRKKVSNKNVELANYLKDRSPALTIKPQTIKNWINGSSPQFYSVYYLCKLKNKRIENYIPQYFNFLLWSQKIISINELEKVRNETFGCLRSFKNGL